MRFKLISCEVLFREMCESIARSPHQVDVEFLSKGLHDLGGKAMRRALQEKIDAVPADSYDAVLMGYALCGNGLHGIEARALPLVIPRAHDCIALLMGSRERYAEFFEANPGTYFRSTGWLERGKSLHQLPVGGSANGASLDDLIERYGEENGRYLFEEFNRYQQQYRHLTYIESGLEPDARFEEDARREASTRGWEFSKIPGNSRLFHQLVNGEWPEKDFLVVPPGARLAASYDDNVIRVDPPVEGRDA
ncbi:MAG: DUF1638 domain-containing protein [Bryobacterales bacterium]|nr:DUF1638 domain-containing protein [Bryobacterales bacterium]